MIKLLHIAIAASLICTSFASKSQCESGRYRDIIFTELDIVNDVTYGNNLSYNGAAADLKMDVYMPSGDLEELRPLVIFLHGGFFVTGDKSGTEVVPACQDLAKMGYVTASINYRLGVTAQLELAQPMAEAVLRSVQDVKAAIRFFRKDVAENGNSYRVNTDQIFIAGVSAGGFATLHAAYMQDDEIAPIVDQSGNGLAGGAEGESGNPGYSSDFLGVISIAGAIGDTTWIEAGDKPACLAHGTGDTVVPFDSDMLIIGGFLEVSEVDGSNSIDQKLSELGVEHCFEIYEGQGHVPSDESTAYYDTTLSIISNFLSHFVCAIDLDCSYREIAAGVELAPDFKPVLIYPNPAGDFATLHLPVASTGILQVFNTSGQLVFSSNIKGELNPQLDLRNLPNGLYQVRFCAETMITYTSHFISQH
ncbi:MAG: alpha/beta hydrolase fold domain-containing protein [Flavobacteriales bacterium]